MKSMKWVLFAVVLMLSVAAPGQAQNEIVLGHQAGFTGPAAKYGQFARQNVELAVEEINKAGGINGQRIKLVAVDDQMNPTTAVSVFRRFVSVNKLPVVLGSHTASGLAVVPVATEKKVVFFLPMSGHPAIAKMSPWSFRLSINLIKSSKKVAEFVYDHGARSVVFLTFNNESTRRMTNAASKTFEQKGGKVLSNVLLPKGKDYRSTILKIKAKNPDAVYINSFVGPLALAVKQMAELNYKPKLFSGAPLEDPKFFQIVGDAAEGMIYGGLASDPGVWKAYVGRYKAKWGEEPEVFGAQNYDAVYVLAKAIKKGGYNAEGIRKALLRIKGYQGVTGTFSFDQNGDTNLAIAMKVVKNRKFEFLK